MSSRRSATGDLIAWITGAYSWELAVPILFGTLTGGVLAATAARGQVFGIDLGAARLELMLDAAVRETGEDSQCEA
jgi:ethanolamine transporter EutH